MSDIEIRPFDIADIDGVFSVILPIQRDEFGIAITADDQPDLAVIPDFYQARKGQFWVAELDGTIVGTLGLKDIGNNQTALRKMFVAAHADIGKTSLIDGCQRDGIGIVDLRSLGFLQPFREKLEWFAAFGKVTAC